MSDFGYWSARKVAGAIKTGELKSRDYVDAMLERIERVDGPYNTVIALDPERARKEADEADRRVAAGDALGPLHGVAMTVKETLDVKGFRTTSCVKMLENYRPAQDATSVARLRAAGAIVVGKTNTNEFASDNQSYNDLFGTSNNPWDTSRTVGGSSGGSAGALALGLTPLELGSDLGGSIRTPAAYCGVVGHKPTYNVIPMLGMSPPPGALADRDIAAVGPMARDCEDAALALKLMAGPDEVMARGYSLRLPPAKSRELKDYRIALWLDDPANPIDREMHARLTHAARSLESAGATVVEAQPGFTFDEARWLYQQMVNGVNSIGFQDKDLDAIYGKMAHSETLQRIRGGPAQRHRSWLGGNEKRHQMLQQWEAFFHSHDVILMPIVPDVAIKHDHSQPMERRTVTINGEQRPYTDLFWWAGIVGLCYLPATSVPVGVTKAGLPVGLQIVGPTLADHTTLEVGRLLMETNGAFRPPRGLGPAST